MPKEDLAYKAQTSEWEIVYNFQFQIKREPDKTVSKYKSFVLQVKYKNSWVNISFINALVIWLCFLCVPEVVYLIIEHFFKNVRFIFHILNNCNLNKANVCALPHLCWGFLTIYCDLERSLQKTHEIIFRIK